MKVHFGLFPWQPTETPGRYRVPSLEVEAETMDEAHLKVAELIPEGSRVMYHYEVLPVSEDI